MNMNQCPTDCPSCKSGVLTYRDQHTAWLCECGQVVTCEMRMNSEVRVTKYLYELHEKLEKKGEWFHPHFLEFNLKPNFTYMDEAINKRLI